MDFMLVRLLRGNNLGREIGVIHCIRKPLSLQTQSRMRFIYNPTFSLHVIDPASGVELHARLIGIQFHNSPRLLILHYCCFLHLDVVVRTVYDVVYVVTFLEFLDSAPDGSQLEEIVWSALYRLKGACGDEFFINGRVLGGVNPKFMGQDIATVMVTKVPIDMRC